MIAKSNCWGCVRNKWSQSCSSTAALKRGPRDLGTNSAAHRLLLYSCGCLSARCWCSPRGYLALATPPPQRSGKPGAQRWVQGRAPALLPSPLRETLSFGRAGGRAQKQFMSYREPEVGLRHPSGVLGSTTCLPSQ